jgi:hypothetical protein
MGGGGDEKFLFVRDTVLKVNDVSASLKFYGERHVLRTPRRAL